MSKSYVKHLLYIFIILWKCFISNNLSAKVYPLDKSYDSLLLKNYDDSYRLLNKQKEWLNSPHLDRATYLENKGDFFYSSLFIDSSLVYYTLSLKERNESIKLHLKRAIAALDLNKKNILEEELKYFQKLDTSHTIGDTLYQYLITRTKWNREPNIKTISNDLVYYSNLDIIKYDKILSLDLYSAHIKSISKNRIDLGILETKKRINTYYLSDDSIAAILFIPRLSNYLTTNNKPNESIEIIDESLKHGRNPFIQMLLINSKAIALKRMQKYNEAESLFLRSLNFNRTHVRLSLIVRDLYHLGDIAFKQQKMEYALKCFEEATALESDMEDISKTAILPFSIGRCYFVLGNFEKAREELFKAENYYRKYQHFDLLLRTIDLQMLLYHNLKDDQKAYASARSYIKEYTNYMSFLDSIKTDSIKRETILINLETEGKNLSQSNLQQQTKIAEQRKKILNISVISSLLLLLLIMASCFLYVRVVQSKKGSKKLNYELQNLRKSIKEKSSIINEFESSLEMDPNSLLKIKSLRDNLYKDKDWIAFQHGFNLIFKGFVAKIMNIQPKLTQTDIRLILLIKLNCSLKEIAEISNITYDGVVKAKQRLKKKLFVEKGEEVDDLIKQL